jgi:hypothetical protein
VGLLLTAYAVPAVGRRVLNARRSRRSAEQTVTDRLRLCGAAPSLVPQDVVQHHFDLAHLRHDHPDVDAARDAAAGSRADQAGVRVSVSRSYRAPMTSSFPASTR